MTLDQWMQIELARQGFQSEPQDYIISAGWSADGRQKFKRVVRHWWHPDRGGQRGKELK